MSRKKFFFKTLKYVIIKTSIRTLLISSPEHGATRSDIDTLSMMVQGVEAECIVERIMTKTHDPLTLGAHLLYEQILRGEEQHKNIGAFISCTC